MSYIGNTPTSIAFLTDTFSGDGTTVGYTMTAAPANTSSIIVAVTGVLQDPSTYSVSGTTLTFSAAPPSGTSNISVRYLGIPASGVTTTAYRTVTNFTATAGQTSFSVPSYTVGYIDVYRNGVRLVSTDYTATTGTTVVLNNACTVGDSVVTESFLVSSVLNAIPATASSVANSYLGPISTLPVSGGTITVPQMTGTMALSTRTVQVFTSSGTYTAPTGLTSAKVTVIGGGGTGGGTSSANLGCGGGGGGGTAISYLSAATIGTSQTVTVGALVAGPSNSNGSSGGTSSFGSLLSATGGAGGFGGGSASATVGVANGGAGGVGTGGTLNFNGNHGLPNAGTNTIGGGGGNSFMGGGGNGINNNGNGNPGLAYGGGGAGGGSNSTPNNGGSGAAGLVFVEEFY